MFGSRRALQLNTAAVGALNQAMLDAQLTSDPPDMGQITDDVLSGKRVVELTEGISWVTVVSWSLAIAFLIVAAMNKQLGQIVSTVIMLLVLLPWIVNLVSEWAKAIPTLYSPYGYAAAPKCDATGCGSAASFVLAPTGLREVRLCDDHKDRLENRARHAALFRPKTAKAIVSAYSDLVKAAKLDPTSLVIQDNLQQAKALAEIVLERKL